MIPASAAGSNAIHGEARTAFELAEQLVYAATNDPADMPMSWNNFASCALAIERMPQLTLEDELIQIFASSPSTRNREILMGYYGWEDGQTHTLTEIGDRFGITRERVRQICAKLIKKYPRRRNDLGAGDGPDLGLDRQTHSRRGGDN